jgi:hypothetical protein
MLARHDGMPLALRTVTAKLTALRNWQLTDQQTNSVVLSPQANYTD